MRRHPVRSDRSVSQPVPRNKAPPAVDVTSRWVRLGACVLALCALMAFWGAISQQAVAAPPESPLVVPGVQALDGGQQVSEARQARLSSVEAVQAREASRTEYEGLGAGQAAQVVGEMFPEVVKDPGGGPPKLPVGQSITGYQSADAAQVDLGEGRHAVIASSEPMATQSSSGQFVPVDLGLVDVGNAFEPRTPAVGVHIPKQLASGVALSRSGVSLTPLDGEGSPVSGSEGVVDDTAAFYADTGVDVGSLVKPITPGFDLATVLFSTRSPEQLSFRVGLPAGARLVQAKDGSVEVSDEGAVIAVVEVPTAHDAEGTIVPTSMTASGDTLVLTVKHRSGVYRYPVEADPTVVETGGYLEKILLEEEFRAGTWGFTTDAPSSFYDTRYNEGVEDYDYNSKEYTAGQYGFFSYRTQGESRIYQITAYTYLTNIGKEMEDILGIENVHSATTEGTHKWIGEYYEETTLCALAECATGTVEHGTNDETEVFFEQNAREAGLSFNSYMPSAEVYILQEAAPTVSFDTADETYKGGWLNGLYPGRWVQTPYGTAAILDVHDPGVGISELGLKAPGVSGWGWNLSSFPESGCLGVQCGECFEAKCGAQPMLRTLEGLPDGEDAIEATVKDPVGLTATAKGIVKVDNTPPYGITLSGLPPGNEIGAGPYRVTASASDGSGKTPSSGVASLTLAVDGQPVGKPSGVCSPGPCKATGEWTLASEEYVAGKHTITITATDAAGNTAKENFPLVIHSAESVAAGPGSVELDSGAFTLNPTDVAISSPGASLTVRRSYDSRDPGAGVKGPLGPQWSGISLTGTESLEELPTGSVVLTAANGQQSLFAREGSKFSPPPGDANLTLSEEKTGVFTLKDQGGSVTTFTVPSGGPSTVLTPSRREEDGGAKSVTYSYQTVAGVTEPTEALAPVAAGVKCTTLIIGCRALTFNYAASTTATGEAPGEWGDYTGRLTRVYFTAWDPSKKEMRTIAVAQYSYDSQGRLRAEWDPRVSPALKTTYGYDTEGQVTSVTPPGQQPWLLTYGLLAGDTHSGRLLTVARPGAETAFGSGEAPKNTSLPTLSAKSLVVGVKLTVSTGSWSNSPLGYSYQWEECGPSGAECTPILGATNPEYMVRYANEGHTIAAQVTATNAAGSVVASTAPSNQIPVALPVPTYHAQIKGTGTTQIKALTGIATFAGETYVTDTAENRVNVYGAEGKYLRSFGSIGEGKGQFKEPTGIAINPNGDVFVADSGNKRIEEFETKGSYIASLTLGGRPSGLAASTEVLYATDVTNDTIHEISLRYGMTNWGSFGSEGSGEEQFKDPTAITLYNGYLYVSDTGNSRIQEVTERGRTIALFGTQGKANGQLKEPTGITVGPSGGVWVADTGNNRVQEFNSQGKYLLQFGAQGKATGQFNKPLGITINEYHESEPDVADTGNGRVEEFLPGKAPTELAVPAATPPKTGSTAVTTIEYQVPVSGAEAPYQLSSAETAAWAQKDNPVEATAIYPPDEPMGWPARDYRRATIYYRDNHDRTVNVTAPSGGISTTEYNSTNDIVRTLTPDDRLAALAEGATSAEASQLLDTKTVYNSEGTEIEETVGPQHNIKLKSGSEALARHRTRYFYDEGAPKAGGPYGLVTKTTEGALLSGGKEEDVRTTATEYGGQGTLGWTLRSPTAIVTDPNGLKITTTTTYDPITGNQTKTTMPAGAESTELPVFNGKFGSFGSKEVHFETPWGVAVEPKGGDVYISDYTAGHIVKTTATGSFVSTISSKGSGEGQVKDPEALTVSSAGNVYVGDMGNHRVDEFSASGKYLGAFGTSGSGEGQFSSNIGGVVTDSSGDVWVSDTNDNRVEEFNSQGKYVRGFGKEGSEAGQFYGPMGLTISAGNLYVADIYNNRVQEFNLEGKYLAQFGSYGNENGQLKEPWAVASDANGDLYVSDRGPDRVEEFSAAGKFLAWLGAYGSGEGQFNDPAGIASNSSGALYVVDPGNYRVDEWTPGNQGAHATQTIYYTAESKSPVTACANHPEWANLPCQTQPAAQPETPNLPNLPVSTITYNIWDEPEAATETAGANTRTTTNTYDEAGRPLTITVKASTGVPVPTVTDKYSPETGALTEQSTTTEGKTQTLTSTYNTLGQLVSSVDADGNESGIAYDIDGRQEKVFDGKGTQTFRYDTTTGAQAKVTDSAAGIFTATYDTQGLIVGESYPNGLKANYTYNQAGQPTSLEYIKANHCGTSCTWYSDHVTPSIAGQWTNQTTSFSTQAYSYDAAGRLTQSQETPTGQNCTTTNYTYDTDTNRTNATKITGSKGSCLTEGGTSEPHSYDTADRLTDTGISYDSYGDITSLPAADAGGATLENTYYTTGQLATQTQGGQTLTYNLDPAGRVRETNATGITNSTTISHYADGSTPAWTIEPSTGKWTRNITAFGSLAATQTNSATAILQLPDLHGDIIATASRNETETKLLSVNETNAYGVPSGTPPRYSWLGGGSVPTELPSGILATGARSYIPQLGRFLQTDPVPGGSANAYTYTFGDPVNISDPNGAYTYGGPSAALVHTIEQIAAEAAAEQAAINAAAAAAAAAKAAAANAPATLNNPEGDLTYSDPAGCRVEPNEITAVPNKRHLLLISGFYACASTEGDAGLAGLSIEIELCVERLNFNTGIADIIRCTTRIYELARYPARKIDFTFNCVEGEVYQTWISGYGRGGNGDGEWTKEGWDEESAPALCF
jgi:RHS repeat-associated protein